MIECINRIYNCDFIDIINKIPNEIFDLVIIDPPYNENKDIAFDNLEHEEYLELFDKWIYNIVQKLKPDGSFYTFINENKLFDIRPILDKYLHFRRNIHWLFNTDFGGNPYNYSNCIEYILYYVKDSNNYTFNHVFEKTSPSHYKRYKNSANKDGIIPYERLPPTHRNRRTKEEYYDSPFTIFKGVYQRNFIKALKPRYIQKEREYGKHPTQKPEKLLKVLIEISSNKGDLIADFFMGSGTTLTVAKQMKRNYFGTEIEKKFFDIAKKRIDNTIVFDNILNFTKNKKKKEKTILDF